MKIAICDDEMNVANFVREKLSDVLREMGKEHDIDVYYNGHDILDKYSQQYEVLFLDICLPDINGYNVAQKIRKLDSRVIIVFLTSVSDFVYEGYNVEAFSYVLKDTFEEKVKDLMIAVDNNIKTKKCYIIVKYKKGCKKIFCDDIMYISSNLRKLVIHTAKDSFSIYGKLHELEKKLSNHKFILTHQSYLINSKYIKTFNSENILMDNDETVPISRTNIKYVKKKVMEYIK